jgi:hypothetical protein
MYDNHQGSAALIDYIIRSSSPETEEQMGEGTNA